MTKAEKKERLFPPVILSHHMLAGLKQGQEKMSKSDPDSAIFMEDTEADVNRKIKKAFCPPGVIEKNPIVDYAKMIVIGYFGDITVKVADKSGEGELVETTFTADQIAEFEAAYAEERIHPGGLKPVVARKINEISEPVRKHFSSGEPA